MKFDAIVIGAGAGGGVAASVLCARGARVLLLEQGTHHTLESTGRDHLRNHRLSMYGDNTHLSGEAHRRVIVGGDGNPTVVKPYQGGFNAIAAGVGSGTVVYGGQAWRFHPLDFKMASTYGVPEGSSLADWPLSYEDLAPWYEKVEHEIGVAGGSPASKMPERADYPMPPLPHTTKGQRLEAAAEGKGWATQRVPLLINSVERDGRPACVNCQHCVGFACPVDAKNGTQNTVLLRAAETGNLTLLDEAVVLDIVIEQGEARGVRYVRGGEEFRAHAPVVVVAASAIESARLLLLSGIELEHLGRNLQGHYYAGASGLMPDPIWDGVGPGASIATLEFSHHNDGVLSGGMLADDFIATPISFAKASRPADVPGWGQGHKDWMRYAYPRFVTATGPVHEIPSPEARVTLDPWVKDGFGRPVARLSGTTHPETVRTATYMNQRGREWLEAAGCERVWTSDHTLRLSAGQHQAGTCRMGEDPSASVVDIRGKVHGVNGLYVADGSVHVTNGGFNPVLTIMATAYRTAAMIGLD